MRYFDEPRRSSITRGTSFYLNFFLDIFEAEVFSKSILCLFVLPAEKSRDEEECGGGADGGVGDVEGWPMAIPREDDIEEIDDIAVEDAVGKVAENTGDEQCCT